MSQSTTRRAFLKTAGAAGATLAVRGAVPAVHAAGSDVLKVGLIGCGGRGTGAAVNALHADQALKLVALADMFKDLGSRCQAGAKMVLMDACRKGNAPEARPRSLRLSKELVPEGVAALLSCKPGENSWEADKLRHGIFFYHVIQGLGERRAPAARRDGVPARPG